MLSGDCFSYLLLISYCKRYGTGNRQVLISGSASSHQVIRQRALLEKNGAGLKERDMVVSLIAGKPALCRKYGVDASEAFVIVLVGKDGTGKYRSKKITSAQHLFALVDAMPMRKQEVQCCNRQTG